MTKYIVTAFILLLSNFTFSQSQSIIGVVSDVAGKPLESANIIAKPITDKATLKFAIADNKGRTKLNWKRL
jgi:hypothetical protein